MCGLLSAVDGRAETLLFSLDTSSLLGTGAVAFDLQLIDGDGPNTSLIVDLVDFGGGGTFGAPLYAGGASGSLGTSVVLTDTAFFNSFSQTFLAGSTLAFRLDVSTSSGGIPQPDGVQFSILGPNGLPFTTTDPAGLNALLFAELRIGGSAVQSFELTGSAVPEPASWILLTSGVVGPLGGRRRPGGGGWGVPGFKGSRVQGFEGSRVRGFKGSRVRGFKGSRVRGFEGSRVRGFEGSRVRGLRGSEVPRLRNEVVPRVGVAENFGTRTPELLNP
jgi:hypothetical protein